MFDNAQVKVTDSQDGDVDVELEQCHTQPRSPTSGEAATAALDLF
jgi:hypothetical protein